MALYGENSPAFANRLKSFKNRSTVLFDAGSTFMPFLYVGNAAWAHVLAAKFILTKPEVIGGQCYNITDDTPVQSLNFMMKPLVLASGYSISITRFEDPHENHRCVTGASSQNIYLIKFQCHSESCTSLHYSLSG